MTTYKRDSVPIRGRSIISSTVSLGYHQTKVMPRMTGSLWGEPTSDRWILLTKGQLPGKRFHVMTSPKDTHLYILYHMEEICILSDTVHTYHCLQEGNLKYKETVTTINTLKFVNLYLWTCLCVFNMFMSLLLSMWNLPVNLYLSKKI